MTNEEARTKWCPFVRVAYAPEAVNGCNRPFGHHHQACIASDCMAWRWLKPAVPARVESTETGTEVPRVKIKPPLGDGWISTESGRDRPDKPGDPPWRWVSWEREIPAVPGDGYCGLAGVPQ